MQAQNANIVSVEHDMLAQTTPCTHHPDQEIERY